MSLKDIKRVMADHVDELMSIPGVVGVAIGQLEDGSPCIQILVARAGDELKKQIPDQFGGFPVVIEVTGTIRGLPGSQRQP
jgi:hypothetical protein